MKQSSNHFKQSSKLTQYSSGEDDSGTEDIFTQKDILFSGYLNHPSDLKYKKTQSQPSNLRHNRLRTARLQQPLNHNAVVRHRSPVVRARLWSERKSDTNVLNECATVPESEILRGTRVLCETREEQMTCHSGNTNNNMTGFLQHGTLKKSDNCRKVLSDITKETVSDYRYQFPSYYSRDVLPLDAEIDCKLDDSSESKLNNTENSQYKKEDGKYDEQANGLLTRTRSTFSNSVDMSKEFKTTEEKCWFSLHYQKVSMILVVIVLLFFFGLGLIYLNVRLKDFQKRISDEPVTKYPICGQNDDGPCIEEDHLPTIVSLLKLITPQLMAIACDSYCNSSGNNVLTMSDSDILNYIESAKNVDREDAKQLLKGLKLLILSNPHGDISVIQDSSSSNFDIGSQSKVSYDNLLLNGELALKNPLIPLKCQLKFWFQTILSWMSCSSTVFIAFGGVLVGVWYYKRRRERHLQEVYMLVNKIINAVRNHHRFVQSSGTNAVPYLTVENCQNEIFGNQHSENMKSAWEEAVRFIDVHESRILTEVHNVHGKPMKVWQWLCAAPQTSETCLKPSTNQGVTGKEYDNPPAVASVVTVVKATHSNSQWNPTSRRNKVWQGQAFETIAGSPNSLPCSPTPCLKIRHMFDPDLEQGDEWPILIQDSILEKCADVCILHLFVDRSSQEGCVFVKCSSSEDAGKAYRALHGWWFDTKLVTVKYLRTERYHERFPESLSASKPLRPSNNECLSLQELWHFPLEST